MAPGEASGRPRENAVLAWAVIVSQFAPPFMFSGVAVALPSMGAELGAGATVLGLVETLFLAGHLGFLLPAGRLADASDKRALYKVGLLGFAVSSTLIAVVSSMPVILLLRFLQGVTGSVFAATGPAILADIVPAGRRGQAYGRSMGAIYSGLTLGPITAGLVSDFFGWRAVFGAGAAVLLVGYFVIRAMLPSSWRWPGRSVHWPSAALVVSAVLCLVAGAALIRNGPLGTACLAGGVGLAGMFLAVQRRLPQPLVDVDALMRNRVLRNALLMQLLLYVNAFSSTFMLSIYMQVALGQSARVAGQVLAIGTVMMAILAPLAGRLADRYPPRLLSIAGVSAVLVATLMAMRLSVRSSLTAVTLVLAVQGLGFALFSSPNMTIIMSSGAKGTMSLASALGAKARALGMVIGMLVTAVLVSLEIGNEPIARHPDRFIHVMTTAFVVLAVLTAAALAVGLVTRARRWPAAAE